MYPFFFLDSLQDENFLVWGGKRRRNKKIKEILDRRKSALKSRGISKYSIHVRTFRAKRLKSYYNFKR